VGTIINRPVVYWDPASRGSSTHRLLAEEPLSIRVQGNPYTVVMRTPGDELAHAAGFCLGEGIVDTPADVVSLAFCDDTDTNVVTVTLTPERRRIIGGHLERRGYISQTSCGLCGKELVEELYQKIRPLDDQRCVDIQRARTCLESLSGHQTLREITRTSHAAALFNTEGALLSVAEDVGRHNALDKAIGKLFLEQRLAEASLLVLSSRISYELVQKAARARIPIILAVSRPTALAVELALKLNITLACLARGFGLYIFCGQRRLNL
jgi:FdhD protein